MDLDEKPAAADTGWPIRLVAMWARHKAAELRRWERKVRKAYREGTPLGEACGPYADALLEAAGKKEAV